MAEILKVMDFVLKKAPTVSAGEVRCIVDGVDTVDRRYSHNGQQKNGLVPEMHLPYHNGMHTRRVLEDAAWIIMMLLSLDTRTPDVRIQVMTAAAWHDAYHDPDNDVDRREERSYQDYLESAQRIPTTSANRTYILGHNNEIRGAIIGTKTRLQGNKLIQLATECEYDSERSQTVAHIVAAADLGHLRRADGPLWAHRLFKEQTVGNTATDPPLDELITFTEQQLDLEYTYPNDAITKIMKIVETPTTVYHARLLHDLLAGNISSWDEVIQRDRAFITEH